MTDEIGTDTVETVSADTENFEDFNKLFKGEADESQPQSETEEASTGEDAAADETDTEVEDTAEHVDPEPKKKKNVQERINELTKDKREAERREQHLAQRLEEALQRLESKIAPEPVTEKTETVAGAPTPDDANEDGSAKYSLGEFDPLYIRDLTAFEMKRQFEEQKAQMTEAEQKKKIEEGKAQLTQEWQTKIESTEESLPDWREKTMRLDSVLNDVDPVFGEYLASTVMSLDKGAEILYYLSDNLDEAKAIVAAGPVAATIALGKLEAQLTSPKATTPKVSKAPEPIPDRIRGNSGKFEVPDDTTDLAAFSRKFYGK